ncbi:lactonase family protein [Hymenobacter sp. HD11105]
MITSEKGPQSQEEYLVYVGTYAKPEQDSIFLYKLNVSTGALIRLGATKAGANPSYLTLDSRHEHLYAVNETTDFQGKASGAVSAFAIDQRNGGLAFLNQQSALGSAPCYISLDKTERYALVASYLGGNVGMLPIEPNGELAPVADTKQHTGSSVHKNQNAPHAHCIVADPANRFVFAVDLGTDKVYGYRLNTKEDALEPSAAPAFTAAPGAGPRHLTFHPGGQLAFLINELNSTITSLRYDEGAGTFQEIQTLPTLPADFGGQNSCADIHVSPNGRFLYGSNRGHDSLVVYSIGTSTGRLSLVEHVPTQGKKPRNFTLDPSGKIALVANQETNNIVTFRVNSDTGQLTPTGNTVQVPAPVCLKVVENFTQSQRS